MQCKKVNHGNVERLYPIPKGEEKGYGKDFVWLCVCVLNNRHLTLSLSDMFIPNKQDSSDALHQTVRIHGAHHEPLRILDRNALVVPLGVSLTISSSPFVSRCSSMVTRALQVAVLDLPGVTLDDSLVTLSRKMKNRQCLHILPLISNASIVEGVMHL